MKVGHAQRSQTRRGDFGSKVLKKVSVVVSMSLWLPRTTSTVLARSYNRFPVSLVSSRRSRPAVLRSSIQYQPSRCLQTSPTPSDHLPPPVSNESKPSAPATADAPLMTRVWKKVKHEAQHYWHGTKLLVSEVRISSRLQWKILQGETLTRRERRQVKYSSSLVTSSSLSVHS